MSLTDLRNKKVIILGPDHIDSIRVTEDKVIRISYGLLSRNVVLANP